MADPKFTPGPWKTGDCDGFIIWAGGYRSVKWIECEPGAEAVHIGDAACPGWALRPEIEAKMSLDDVMAREEWIEECKANARLMAAAPDHALLCWAMCVQDGRWEEWTPYDGKGEFVFAGLRYATEIDEFGCPTPTPALRAAITKARGQS